MTPSGAIPFHHCGVSPPDELRIVPLTPDRFDDLGELFATGDPRWCWCMYFRARGQTWANASPRDNRDTLRGLTELAGKGGGETPGLVAYAGKQVAGWVSLGPREDYERLAYAKLLRRVDERPVWSIVCFVVGRQHRRRGVASALLDAAIAHARERAATTLEAYPLHESRGKVSSSAAYVGTQGMFERAGFEVVELRQWNAETAPRPIMRLELG
jgi:ribosomal protein S18 acetylase RimI-like enzyme